MPGHNASGTTSEKRGENRRAARLRECCNFFVYNFFRMLRFLSAGESHGQALVITARRHAGGPRSRHRCAQRAAAAPPGRLRPRPADGHRKRPRRDSRRRPPRPDDRRADRAAHSQSRLGQLAADDVRRARDAGGGIRHQARRTSRGRGPVTRIWPAPSSTATRTSATCSSARARARRRRASRPARWRVSSSDSSAFASPATCRRSATWCFPRHAHGLVRRGAGDRRRRAAAMRRRVDSSSR